MLTEVVQPGPFLTSAWTVTPKTHVQHFGAAFWFLFVDALFMSCKVIDGAEAFLPRTTGLVAFEQLSVSRFMLPAANQLHGSFA